MFILFDIGGTNLRVAATDGKTLSRPIISPTPPNFQEGLKLLIDSSQKLAQGVKIDAIAGGIAGPLDQKKTMPINAPNLSGWNNQTLTPQLSKSLGAPVYLENDTAMACLGEAYFGTGKGFPIVAYLTISTGVGGARVVDGKIDRSSQGFEPGHQIINGEDQLENLVSGPAIEKKYGQKPQDIKDSRVWDEVARWLAIGLNNTIVHWSPDIVILGGSVMNSIPIDNVNFYLKETLTIFPVLPKLVKSNLGDLNGLYGALAYLNSTHS